MTKKIATVGENDREVRGLEQSRSLIRAAYQADMEDILHNNEGSAIFELGDSFVIAALAGATEEGTASFEEVRPRVELAVKKQKKGEALATKMADAIQGNDLQAAATKLNVDVKDANGLTFNSTSIPAVGMEPAVIGTVANLSQDQVSAPIVGNNGVYLAKVVSISEGSDEDVLAEQSRLNQAMGYRAAYQAYEAQRNAIELKTNVRSSINRISTQNIRKQANQPAFFMSSTFLSAYPKQKIKTILSLQIELNSDLAIS